MFKVLIADDERRVVKMLKASIPWEKLDMELVEPAYNGIDALDITQKNNVDIVITDIRMPGMSGLDLCMELQNLNPNIQIIIISGFADFAYAQKAIQYRVLGYCLKPINYTEVINFLKIAANNLKKDIPINYDSLLESIENEDNELTYTLIEKMQLDPKIIYVASSVGCNNIIDEIDASLALKIGNRKYIYLSSSPINKQAAYNIVTSKKSKTGMGIYPYAVDASELKSTISDTVIMSYHFFLTGKSDICERIIKSSATKKLFTRLNRALTLNNKEELKNILEEMMQIDCSTIFNISTAFKFYNFVYSSNLLGQIIDKEDRYLYSCEQLVTEYSSFSNMLNEMYSQLTQKNGTDYSMIKSCNSNFMSIIKYINANYEKDISLKSIADTLHMNPNYISQLFKKETGITYTQYLTDLRINKAKHLLQTTDLSINEVSEAVGFNDYFYFLKTFKKIVGITPGKFIN